MTRETAKKNLEIIKAYAEGKDVQRLSNDNNWEDIPDPKFFDSSEYRIKQEPKYEPWTAENCPLKCGDVLIDKFNNKLRFMVTGTDFTEKDFTELYYSKDDFYSISVNGKWVSFKVVFDGFVMADGTPCGTEVVS